MVSYLVTQEFVERELMVEGGVGGRPVFLSLCVASNCVIQPTIYLLKVDV